MSEHIQASPGSLASVQETVYILRKVRPLVVNRSVVDIVRRLARQLLPHEFQYESPTQEQARDIITELIMQLHRGSINHQGMAKIHDAFEGVVKASLAVTAVTQLLTKPE